MFLLFNIDLCINKCLRRNGNIVRREVSFPCESDFPDSIPSGNFGNKVQSDVGPHLTSCNFHVRLNRVCSAYQCKTFFNIHPNLFSLVAGIRRTSVKGYESFILFSFVLQDIFKIKYKSYMYFQIIYLIFSFIIAQYLKH